MDTVYTIGHSNQSLERFVSLLSTHEVTAVGDVRSHPYSTANPQFDRETLAVALESLKIAYVYLGKELGARTEDPSCYLDGKVQYDRLAATSNFQEGRERVRRGMQNFRVALMCAEGEPLACHRTILVSRYLQEAGVSVSHILRNGTLEDHHASMERLRSMLGLDESHFFRDKRDAITEAYRLQGEKIAYKPVALNERKEESRSLHKGQ
jgi:uncharacterized protein (DUF488 family)